MNETLCFIGGGHMARSLIGGLIARGVPAKQCIVADPSSAQLDSLRAEFSVRTTSENAIAARDADVIVFAVKPQELRSVAHELRRAIEARGPLLISVAAGIRARDIQQWTQAPVVRCMPNRPALQGNGVTGLFATDDVPDARRQLAEQLLSAVGKTLWLERESDMDAVTAISGSGPAYFFLLIEMLEQTGVKLGLRPETARTLAIETAYGSGWMAKLSSTSPAVLREQVTSKGGTTAAALACLEAHGVRAIFDEAVTAAARRSAELAEEFGR